MTQPIQRDGTWWVRRPDGNWLRFNAATNSWEHATPPPEPGAAPPPPPPPPVAVYTPLPTTVAAPRRSISVNLPAMVVACVLGAVGGFLGVKAILGDDPKPVSALAIQPQTESAAEGAGSNFMREVERICTEADGAARTLGAPQSPDEFISWANELESLARGFSSELSRLTPPKKIRAVYSQYLKLSRSVVRMIEAMKSAGAVGDGVEVQRLAVKLQKLGGKADALALGAGLPAICYAPA